MAIGPGSSIQQLENPKPLLWFASDNDVIQIFNPLTEDFVGLVGQSRQVDTPFKIAQTQGLQAATGTEGDAMKNYGLNLKNPEHFSAAQITTRVNLPAGQTTSLLGGVAKVVVTQLVNEIMQRDGSSLKMADPTARNEVERTVIKSQGTVQQYLPNFQTERQQVDQAITKLNYGETYEPKAFPPETRQPDTAGVGSSAGQARDSNQRSPGRPKKS